jgi:hypothetical protein
MRESTDESPLERGEAKLAGRCEVCGAEGETIAVPGAPPPNELCARCAIELRDHVGPAVDDVDGIP